MLDIGSVQYAILETDGNLSVFPFPKERPASAKEAGIEASPQSLPVTVIEDGYFSAENLALTGKDEIWLEKILEQNQATRQETFLLTVDKRNRTVFIRKEAAQ